MEESRAGGCGGGAREGAGSDEVGWMREEVGGGER